jgi:hypothetical protein
MKMNKIFLRTTAIAAIFTAVLLLNACKKSSSSSSSTTNDNGNAAALSANGATSDNTFDDVLNITIQTNQDNTLNSIIQHQGGTITNGAGTSQPLGLFYCANVTVTPADTISYPKTIVVDFGAGCTSLDGITRSGSITYTLSERFRNPGAVISATFTNYVVNGYQLGGTYTLTNNSSLSGVAYTTAVTGGTITYPNDTAYSFAGTKTVTQTAGIGSTNLSTYVFSVTGNYTITNTTTGEMLSAKVTTPLVKDENCANIVSGIESFAYKNGSVSLSGTLDFGSGTCDNIATVTIGSFTGTVTLH